MYAPARTARRFESCSHQMINTKHKDINSAEWAEEILGRLQKGKGFRKPSKVEVDHALYVLHKKGALVNTAQGKKRSLIHKLFPSIAK